jgi:hypothetical protein
MRRHVVGGTEESCEKLHSVSRPGYEPSTQSHALLVEPALSIYKFSKCTIFWGKCN